MIDEKLMSTTKLKTAMNSLETRKATDSDFEFIFSLHEQTLYKYIEQTWGWAEDFQRSGMREDFDTLPFEIICYQREDIGILSVVDEEDELRLNYLAIAPIYQRLGFGTQIMRQVLERAAKRKISVRLNVIRINPAKAFYERFGFKVCGGDEHLLFMELSS
jgi:ribosomal protein S18 acetylase RimI-like enzyme